MSVDREGFEKLAAPVAKDGPGGSVAFLIERVQEVENERPQFYKGGDLLTGWTTDSFEAIRFARRLDAVRFIDLDRRTQRAPLMVVEHRWIDNAALREGAKEGT